MINKKVIIVTLLCMSVLSWTNSCPGFYANDLLQSGKNSFIRSGSSNPQYSFDAPISFDIPATGLQLASCVSSIGDYNPNGGFNYQLSGSRRGNSNFVQFSLVVLNGGWTSMQVSWFASARDDFAVNNIQYSANQWGRLQSANTYQIWQNIPKNLDNYQYKVAAFISSYSTSDSQFKISITKKSFDKYSKKLLLNLFCQSNPLPTSLTIAYIIYPDNHPQFQLSYQLAPQGDTGSYQITGAVNIASYIEYNQFRIANRYLGCSGNQCGGLSCMLKQKCSQLNGNSYQGQCYFCSPGIVFQYGLCTRRCGANQLYINRVCVCNQGYVRRGNACVLANQPPQCRNNQILYNNQCRACPYNANVNGDTCRCPQGYNYDINNNICNQIVQACQYGEYWNNGACVCNNGWGRYNGQCIQCPSSSTNQVCLCPSGQIFDVNSRQCQYVNNCPYGQRWNGNACVCNWGTILWNNQCVQCPTGSQINDVQNSCNCQNGYLYNSQANQCLPNCLPNQRWNGSQCVCNYGTFLYNNKCVQCPTGSQINQQQNGCNCQAGYTYDIVNNRCIVSIPTCRDGQRWNGNACVCDYNRILWNNQCVQCPTGSQINQAQTSCNCQSGYTYNVQANRCDVIVQSCPAGQRWNGNACVCVNTNWVLVNGRCQACPRQARYSNGQCVCPTAYNYDSNTNTCVYKCISPLQWNGNACVCPSNSISWNSQCKVCPTNSKPNQQQTTCICDNNWQYDVNNNRCNNPCGTNQVLDINGRCVCLSGYYLYNSKCRACPTNAVPNNQFTSCICNRNDYTFDIVANRCVITQCPINQIWNNGRCICATNFINYNGNCRQCPLNSLANNDQTTCNCQAGFNYDLYNNRCNSICGSSQVWSSRDNKCVCIDGYHWYNQACRQCPASAQPTPDQSTCKCIKQNAIYYSSSNLCIECGANSQPNAQRTGCECLNGFVLQNGQCVGITCEFNQDYVNGQCQCKYGWIRVGPLCVQACGINQNWDGNNKKCFCKEGHARYSGVCKPCGAGSSPNSDKSVCKCNDPKQYFDNSRFFCVQVPANSNPSQDGSDFVCWPGYTKANGQCNSNCASPSFPDSNGNCVCSNGNIWSNGQCIPPVSCPAGSRFNTATSSCVCIDANQNLVNGVCKSCGENSIWSNGQCVCNTNFFSIGGVCRACDPRTKYNGTDCLCQLGYFGNRDLCTPCHKSCSQCTGSLANQCTACSDISLVLEKGYCVRNSPCDFGFFLDSGSCSKCTDNCIDCTNIFECKTCSIGYNTLTQTAAGQSVVSCSQICGDGIKFEQQCDDGNTKAGDGCSSTCETQPGWFCSGGSSSKPSNCRKFIPDTVQLSSKGAVNLGGYVLLSVRASYLPSCITQNQCATCFKVLQVNVVNATVPILTTVNYVPFSQYQFYLKFDFQGLFVSSTFKVVIKLNDAFKGCIAEQDYNQQLELTIDPAFLAKVDQVGALTIDQIDPNADTINVPEQAKRYLGE